MVHHVENQTTKLFVNKIKQFWI